MDRKPQLIEFSRIGNSHEGYISVAELEGSLPFEVKRIFWTYFTPESVVRGRHAHYKTEQILIAVSGKIIVTTQSASNPPETETFVLESPNLGVYIPPDYWHTMQYSHSAVQLVLASTQYDENDYIRSFDDFSKIYGS